MNSRRVPCTSETRRWSPPSWSESAIISLMPPGVAAKNAVGRSKSEHPAQIEQDQGADRDDVERQRGQARQPGRRAGEALGREGAAQHHAEQRDHRLAQAGRDRAAETADTGRGGGAERAEQPRQRQVEGREQPAAERADGERGDKPRADTESAPPAPLLLPIGPWRQARPIAARAAMPRGRGIRAQPAGGSRPGSRIRRRQPRPPPARRGRDLPQEHAAQRRAARRPAAALPAGSERASRTRLRSSPRAMRRARPRRGPQRHDAQSPASRGGAGQLVDRRCRSTMPEVRVSAARARVSSPSPGRPRSAARGGARRRARWSPCSGGETPRCRHRGRR